MINKDKKIINFCRFVLNSIHEFPHVYNRYCNNDFNFGTIHKQKLHNKDFMLESGYFLEKELFTSEILEYKLWLVDEWCE